MALEPEGKRKWTIGRILGVAALVIAGLIVLSVGYCFIALSQLG